MEIKRYQLFQLESYVIWVRFEHSIKFDQLVMEEKDLIHEYFDRRIINKIPQIDQTKYIQLNEVKIQSS